MPLLSTSRPRASTPNTVSSQYNIISIPLVNPLFPIDEPPLSKFARPAVNQSDRFPDPGNQQKSAWEYYLEITGIADDEDEREWQDLLDVILVFVRPPRTTRVAFCTADRFHNPGCTLRLLPVHISHPDPQSPTTRPTRRHPGYPPLPDTRYAEQHIGAIRFSSVLPTSLRCHCEWALLCQPRRRPPRRVSMYARQRVDTRAR